MRAFRKAKNRQLHLTVLVMSVAIAVYISQELVKVTENLKVQSILSDAYIQLIIAIIVAVFGYQTIIFIVLYVINQSKNLLHLYWGRLYLDGYWYYEYVKLNEDGESEAKPKYGIWHIEQDVYGTHISGFGLYNNHNKYRTTVESKTELIENEHCFEVILSKIEASKPGVKYFAKASITIDNSRKWKKTLLFHSYTYTYGGSQAGEIHIDVYHKVPKAKTEDDVINHLRDNGLINIKSESDNITVQTDRKQNYEFNPLIKLDENFEIHVNTSKLIKKGIDTDERKYYKIYYDEEY